MKNKEKIIEKVRELRQLLVESGNPYILLVDGNSETLTDGEFTGKELNSMLYNGLKDTPSGLSVVLAGLNIMEKNGFDVEIMREPLQSLIEQFNSDNDINQN